MSLAFVSELPHKISLPQPQAMLQTLAPPARAKLFTAHSLNLDSNGVGLTKSQNTGEPGYFVPDVFRKHFNVPTQLESYPVTSKISLKKLYELLPGDGEMHAMAKKFRAHFRDYKNTLDNIPVSIVPSDTTTPVPLALLRQTSLASAVTTLNMLPSSYGERYLYGRIASAIVEAKGEVPVPYDLNKDEFPVLRLMTYNMCGSRLLFPLGHSRGDRYRQIADRISLEDPNIFTAQEAWNSRSRRVVRDMFPHKAHFADRRPGLIAHSGLATGTSFEVVASKSYTFKSWSGIEFFARKGAIFTEIKHPQGRHVQLWNVHLASSPEGGNHAFTTEKKAGVVRNIQRAELEEWISRLERPGVPVFIIGDFNTDSEWSNLGTDLYRARCPYTMSGVLQEKDIAGITFDPAANTLAKGRHERPERLDRLVLRNLDPKKVAVGTKVIVDSKGKELSDHYALSCEVVLLG